MYDSIVPAQCELYYADDRLQVKLKKKNHGVHWRTFEDEMVILCEVLFKYQILVLVTVR